MHLYFFVCFFVGVFLQKYSMFTMLVYKFHASRAYVIQHVRKLVLPQAGQGDGSMHYAQAISHYSANMHVGFQNTCIALTTVTACDSSWE